MATRKPADGAARLEKVTRAPRPGPSQVSRGGGKLQVAARPEAAETSADIYASKQQVDSGTEGEADDITLRTKLDLSGNALPPVEQLIETLSRFPNVQRLDLSAMQASEAAGHPRGLTDLSWIGKAAMLAAKRSKKPKNKARDGEDVSPTFGDRLTWLKVSDNAHLGENVDLEPWAGLERLHKLAVLNASSCALQKAPQPPVLMGWASSLCALILGHNALTELPHFPSMPLLNTIVLSHNQLTVLPADLPANVPALKKLSITHNQLSWNDDASPLPDFSLCSHLREVRISGNGSLKKLPKSLATWGRGVGSQKQGTGLEIFEAADCGLSTYEDMSPLLVSPADKTDTANVHPDRIRTRGLNSLLLKGNAIASEPAYQAKLLATHPSLKVLDNVRLQPRAKPTLASKSEQNDEDTVQVTSDPSEKPIVTKVTDRSVKTAPRGDMAGHEASPPAEEGDPSRKKKHKRGGRGGKGKGNAEGAEEQPAKSKADVETEKRKTKNLESTRAKGSRDNHEDDEHLKRIMARAGPSNGAKMPKIAKDARAMKTKRKAWDEGESAKVQASASRAPAPKKVKQDARPSPEATEVPAKTSVAGIVDVAKAKKGSAGGQQKAKAATARAGVVDQTTTTTKKPAPAWNAPRADLSIGQGGAWD